MGPRAPIAGCGTGRRDGQTGKQGGGQRSESGEPENPAGENSSGEAGLQIGMFQRELPAAAGSTARTA